MPLIRILLLTLVGIFTLLSPVHSKNIHYDVNRLSMNDLSYLWPVPQNANDVERLLSASTKIGEIEIWPENSFHLTISTAKNKIRVPGIIGTPEGPERVERKIEFNRGRGEFHADLTDRNNWKVVGFRVDPSAPSGFDKATIQAWGTIPQIRLILQPVTLEGDNVIVHDFTAHVPFNFTTNEMPPFVANEKAFKDILKGVFKLKQFLMLSANKVSTDGKLRVNPGLAQKVPGYAEQIKDFLEAHLPKGQITLVSFMGLTPSVEPWVFFSTPIQNETKPLFQRLETLNTAEPVSARIHGAVNSNWLDGKAALSTAILYQNGVNLEGEAIKDHQTPLIEDIPNIIANPKYSNVINTDCMSCHSETTLRERKKLTGITQYQYCEEELIKSLNLSSCGEGLVDNTLLPSSIYNVRNLGWFSITDVTKPHISMRTANETLAVLKYINEHYADID